MNWNRILRLEWLWMLLLQIICVIGTDPKFDPSTRMRLVLVPADAQVGSVIYRLRATDDEFDYPLTFELVGDSSASTVQIDTLPCTKYNSVCQANVVLTRRLDPGRFYDFQVSVKDTKGGTASQSCSITATNFTTPHDMIFPHKPGIIMIPEDAKRGTELDYVISRKNPLFPKPVYLELWGSPLFAIRQKVVSPETTEGTIFLLGPLDFEKQAMYHLTVLATDAYAEPRQDSRNIAGLEVVVIVQDVQDVPPVFTAAPPVTRLPAGLLPGDKVLQVHAEDGDKGNPREIRYGLVSEGNPFTSFFDINDTTGEIFLLQPLDDISALIHVGDAVLLTVIAEEVKVARDEPPAMATTVQLAFFLPERSNSPPYFGSEHYVSRIEENAPQGTALVFNDPYVAGVFDDDTGKNGVFSLTLLGNNGTFEITPNVAERRANFIIRVRDGQLLDFEERHSVEFQILAQELGPATNLSALVNVTVYIDDVNDNPPTFDQPMYTVELPENMTSGTKVMQVHATDVDSGMGGRLRYTQILGYLNTSLNLDAESGLITVSRDSHGFDREQMSEYHLYVEARDDDGTGNRVQVPIIIKMIDVNDNAPVFEKPLYEFILTPDLKNFTNPAYIKALDQDAEAPNNEVRYEIINGNYEDKFQLDTITGQLTLRAPLNIKRKQSSRKRRQANDDSDVVVLTARAYDLGVPVMFSMTTMRVYPPESKARTLMFVVPGRNPDRQKTEETLSAITGGRVTIHDIRPYTGNEDGATTIGGGGNMRDKSVVYATVQYDSNGFVDIDRIQQRLQKNGSYVGIIESRESSADTVYKAENRVLFWLLIFLALVIAIAILSLLFCCICSWCPLYGATRKRVIRVNSTEDDVHLVHREKGVGKQTKSVQVAEWMGRREAWSAEKSNDSRTKPTRWEFSRRVDDIHQKLGNENVTQHEGAAQTDAERIVMEGGRVRSAEDKRSVKIRHNHKEIQTAKETQFHNSRTNLIVDREVYVQDVGEDYDDTEYVTRIKKKPLDERHIDDDSMRRHEIDRGSELGYAHRGSMKRQAAHDEATASNREQLFIKDGNAEILRLITRGKHDEENIYVNVPPHQMHQTHPQYIMVDNGGKEILMRRFIEEQPNGKQIIREHYQVIPGASYVQTQIPNEVQNAGHLGEIYINKSQGGSMILTQPDQNNEVKIVHSHNLQAGAPSRHEHESQMQPAISNQSLIQQELENSLKQQNELLRQILLEKEKLEVKYNQQEIAMETQSLPGHSLAIATQTECNAETQTEPTRGARRRRARSENDDSMSEEDYEYIRYSPPNSPEGVYWIKRKKHKKKLRGAERHRRRRVVMVEQIKRKIRTPIKEENEEGQSQTPPKKHSETKTSVLRRLKNEGKGSKHKVIKTQLLDKEVLMEISDSLDEQQSPQVKEKRKHIYRKQVEEPAEYYDDSDDDIVVRRNYYSADSLDDRSDPEEDDDYQLEDEIEESATQKHALKTSRQGRSHRGSDAASHSSEHSHQKKIPLVSKTHISRRESSNEIFEKIEKPIKPRRQVASEPPHRPVKGPAPKPPEPSVKSRKPVASDRARSETDLLTRMAEESQESSKSVPKYMEWYYNKDKDDKARVRAKPVNKKLIGASEKRIKAKAPKADDRQDDGKYKPEPLPRKSPPKEARMLKEDIQISKSLAPHIQTDTNHPLLQYSEHRFEHKYNPQPEIPIPPVKLPHYMYPETPPLPSVETKHKVKDFRPKPSPIHEHEVKLSSSSVHQSKQLNAANLEDDHDSGIAMNSLLHSMGRRNPIADKKSVFTIAYDDVKIKKIQSESDSPQFS